MNILITGASRGIGLEFVKQYLRSSAVKKVWVVTQHPEKLSDLISQSSGRVIPIAATVSKPESLAVIESTLGNDVLDLLINNAGTFIQQSNQLSYIDLSKVVEEFSVNTISAMRVCQACLPALKRATDRGLKPKVVQISSLMGSIEDNTTGGNYGYRISKAALNMFNKSFSIEQPALTSVVLHPGWVKTDMGGSEAPTTPQESVSGMIALIEKLGAKDTGKYFDFGGDLLPW